MHWNYGILNNLLLSWFIHTLESVYFRFSTHILFLQLNAIGDKYADLEKEYRRSRGQGKDKLSEYKEEAGIKLTQLHDVLKIVRSEISRKHIVSLIKFY